ncbi:MAG TPA: Crp/Fnr family transcriptional regulator [Acidobacteriaceae bacterium]|nr:Crp/Fnr family transcriptional regulator [Acidobacteriaceae bacterium]
MFNRIIAGKDLQQASLEDGCREENIPAFAPLAERYTEAGGNTPPFLTVGPGVNLVNQWRHCDYVYLLSDGLVKLTYASENGSQVALGLRSSGWYAGATSVLLKIPSVYSAITLSECTVSQIPAEQFFYWATHDIRTLRHFLKSMSLDSTSQTRLHAEIQSNNAAERLEHFMQERTAADPHWQTMDPLPLLKQGELAQLLSVTPEHLSRLRQQQRRHRAFSRAS